MYEKYYIFPYTQRIFSFNYFTQKVCIQLGSMAHNVFLIFMFAHFPMKYSSRIATAHLVSTFRTGTFFVSFLVIIFPLSVCSFPASVYSTKLQTYKHWPSHFPVIYFCKIFVEDTKTEGRVVKLAYRSKRFSGLQRKQAG